MFMCTLMKFKLVNLNPSENITCNFWLPWYHSFYNAYVVCFQCLKKWGFRRCEDICWIKTNIKNPLEKRALDPSAVLQRTKVAYR